MEKKDNRISAPLAHYLPLYRGLDTRDAAVRCGIAFDAAEGGFTLTHFREPVFVAHPQFEAFKKSSGEALPDALRILLLRYIIEGALGEGSGKFLAYAEMPWGGTYLSSFKGRCIARLAHGFGRDLPGFKRACGALGGIPAPGGDAAYDLEFISGFTLRVIIWAGDEEFPPNAQILFSDNFPLGFSAEDMAAVGDVLLGALKKTQRVPASPPD